MFGLTVDKDKFQRESTIMNPVGHMVALKFLLITWLALQKSLWTSCLKRHLI